MPPNEPSNSLPSVLVRLLVGHDTERLDKPNEDGRTHKWKIFVRPTDGFPPFTDRSFIKKMIFQLHETFQNPKRSVRKPPFEVEDTAYGCFEVRIQIEFRGVEKIFTINHDLSLSINKHASVSFNHWIEVSNPPSREFIDLAIKYGGKLKPTTQDKLKSSTPRSVESDDKSKKSSSSKINTNVVSVANMINVVPLESDKESLTSQSTGDKEKHKKKHKEHKEHKKKKKEKEKPDNIKSPPRKEPLIEMPKLKVQSPCVPIEASSNLDDLFEEPSPKREKKDEKEREREKSKKKSSKKDKDREKTSIPEVSAIKRLKIVVSSKEELPNVSSNEKVEKVEKVEKAEKVEKVEKISPLLNFIDAPQIHSNVMRQIDEFAKPPNDPISPIGKLKLMKNEELDEASYQNSPPQLNQSDQTTSTIKDDAYWENFNKIRSLLSHPLKRGRYNLGFLHKLDKVNHDLISRYERRIPLVKFEEDFMKIQFKKEDNRKFFERNSTTEEPMMLRVMKRSESPKQIKNDAFISDLFN